MDINHYAFMAVIKGKSSARQYKADLQWPIKSLTALLDDNEIRRVVDDRQYQFGVPIQSYLTYSSYMRSCIASLLLTVFGFMVVFAYIVSNQIIQSYIEKKAYEYAMIRCLGWNEYKIVMLTVLKANVIQIFPSLPIGMALAWFAKEAISRHVKSSMGYDLMLDFSSMAI